MNQPKGKPPGQPVVPPIEHPDEPGRLEVDDRGNVTWNWSDDVVLQADDTLGAAERLRVLIDPKLDTVEDTDLNPIKHNAKGLKKGYDPYDSGALGKNSWKKKKNLRELSKWIELKRKVEDKKKGD